MSAVQENSQWRRFGIGARVDMCSLGRFKRLGNARQKIADCRVPLGRTEQKGLHQPGCFPKRMPRSQLRLETLQFWCRALREPFGKR